MKKNTWLWGFTDSAEMWNGRFAMIGFMTVVFIESTTGQGLLYLLGVISQ
nr:Ycf17 protein [Pyropia sp. Myanmar_A]BED43337.1 Ycf17 protein [Pyropia sp. Myanmar_B]BED43534.1 Ycf17 protein [Pyropia sp. Myanmar_C]